MCPLKAFRHLESLPGSSPEGTQPLFWKARPKGPEAPARRKEVPSISNPEPDGSLLSPKAQVPTLQIIFLSLMEGNSTETNMREDGKRILSGKEAKGILQALKGSSTPKVGHIGHVARLASTFQTS